MKHKQTNKKAYDYFSCIAQTWRLYVFNSKASQRKEILNSGSLE